MVIERSNGRYLALLLFGNCCASTAFGILSPTIVANCLDRGTSTWVIGVLTSIWALPFLIAAPIYTRIVGRFSAKLCLLIGMSGAVVSLCLFPVIPYDWAWIVLQVLCGATLGHFSLITEAWLNLFSTDKTRGRVTSLYGIIPALGYAVGIALYITVGYHGYAPFLTAAGAMAAGVVPILLIPTQAADIVLGGEERIRRAFRLAPFLLGVGFLAGILETVPWGLLQVYAVDNKWSTRAAASALPIFYWGQILLTFPIGWVADLAPRRSVLIATSMTAIVCMAGLASLAQTPAIWGIIFMAGGIATATYTLGLAILGQRFEAVSLVSVNAAFLACYGAGTILGPPVVGALMDRFGPTALPTALACVSACIFACAIAARQEWRRLSTIA